MCLLGYKNKKRRKSRLCFCRRMALNNSAEFLLQIYKTDAFYFLMILLMDSWWQDWKKKKIPEAEISPKLSSFYPPSTADKSSHVLHFNRFTLCYLHACSCLLRRLKILRKPNSKLEFLSSPDATCEGGVTFAWLMILKHWRETQTRTFI